MRQRTVAVEKLVALSRKALTAKPPYGFLVPDRYADGHYRERFVQLKLAMDCNTPYEFVLYANRSAEHRLNTKPLTVMVEAQCRKCDKCQRRRRMRWAARAVDEFHKSDRTWFATFTIAPQEHEYRDLLLRSRLRAQRVDFDKDLTEPEKFTARARMFGGYPGFRKEYGEIDTLTEYFKRLRKRSDFRYLLVAEAHSGESNPDMKQRPHFHMLIHEKQRCSLVSCVEQELRWVKTRKGWRQLVFAADWAGVRTHWKAGFTKVQLCQDANTATYLCKYLSKSLTVRVRNSLNYGKTLDPEGRRVEPEGLGTEIDPKKASAFDEGRDPLEQRGSTKGVVEGVPRSGGDP